MTVEEAEYLKDTTLTFRILYRLNLMRDVQKHGKVTFLGLIWFTFKTIFRRIIFTYGFMDCLFEPINKKILRPWIWKRLGCKVGHNVHIGHMVRPDFGNADRIRIGNNVVISNGVTILCHKRDVSGYKQGDMSIRLPFIYKDVEIQDGCQIGLNCTILPGVTIGEGSIVGSCSLVTKDIPAWSVAVGSPAKVIKSLNS
ncbi:MAG: acyltransferase [Bacteroidales bacterium]|nr:acyltransferase [Bacteroidales bacterium]